MGVAFVFLVGRSEDTMGAARGWVLFRGMNFGMNKSRIELDGI